MTREIGCQSYVPDFRNGLVVRRRRARRKIFDIRRCRLGGAAGRFLTGDAPGTQHKNDCERKCARKKTGILHFHWFCLNPEYTGRRNLLDPHRISATRKTGRRRVSADYPVKSASQPGFFLSTNRERQSAPPGVMSLIRTPY